MLSRDRIEATIFSAYGARQKGDKEALAGHWAPGAVFRLAGDHSLLGDFPGGPAEAAAAVDKLIDRFTFHALDAISLIVAGNRAAVHWRVKLSPEGGEPIETELADFLTFDDAGRITELVEFADTAVIARLAAAGLGRR